MAPASATCPSCTTNCRATAGRRSTIPRRAHRHPLNPAFTFAPVEATAPRPPPRPPPSRRAKDGDVDDRHGNHPATISTRGFRIRVHVPRQRSCTARTCMRRGKGYYSRDELNRTLSAPPCRRAVRSTPGTAQGRRGARGDTVAPGRGTVYSWWPRRVSSPRSRSCLRGRSRAILLVDRQAQRRASCRPERRTA
jgi:hypothetical protein